MSQQEDANWYYQNRAQFVGPYLNQFVMIKDQQLIAVFPSYDAALGAAVASYGTDLPYIHEVKDPEPTEIFVATGPFMSGRSRFFLSGAPGIPWGARAVHLGDGRRRRAALGAPAAGSVPELLRSKGALIQVRIGNASVIAAKMREQGSQVPPPKAIMAMIDTGASISAIDSSVAASLGLSQTGSVQVGGVGGVSQQPVFAAAIEFTDPVISYDPLSLSGASLGAPDFQLLIGRNILCQMILTYDGPRGRFSLVRA